MTTYPHFPTRTVHRLNGIWDVCYLGDDIDLDALDPTTILFNDRLAVPGCFDTHPSYAGKRGTMAYRKIVHAAPRSRGLLTIGGLGLWARVLVDGEPVHESAMPYTDITIDVPPSMSSRRELVIVVDNRFDRERVPLMEQFFDFYGYGGIYRHVAWHELPGGPVLDRAEVLTDHVARGAVTVRVRWRHPVPSKASFELQIDDGPWTQVTDCSLESGVGTVKATVADPSPWSPDSPVLHTCRVRCGEDEIVERFGLRTVCVQDGCVAVNGTPVKLLGYCRHEAHPQFGPALPLQQLVQDLQLLRDLGCNFIRGSHYPQDQRFLDLCDEMGMLVFEESLGWGQKPEHFNDPSFCEAQVAQTTSMVRKSINHPTVIMWGFLNEGASHTEDSRALYRALADSIRALDPSRLVTYATMHPFDDVNLDLTDVISVNTYPGWYAQDQQRTAPSDEIVPRLRAIRSSLKARGFGDKPLIISEIGAGAIYGWRDALRAHWSEEYQRDYLDTVCAEVCRNTEIAGVALWQFCDCRTYSSAMALRRPRAYNNKGTLDEYRRPKLAYDTVRTHFRGNGQGGHAV